MLQASAAGATYYVQGSNDGFATAVTLASGSMPAGTAIVGSTRVTFATYLTSIVNGSNANTVYVSTSFTAA